ncbi:DNA-processing protein DprA [Candidatus Babeliales bacterium]|nr:DNA-processing protein DprA [Candidatus Babeliales bacterium]
MNNNKRALLHLSLIPSIGPSVVEKIVQHVPETFDFYGAGIQDFAQCGITEKVAQLIVNGLSNDELIDAELYVMEKHGISWITLYDDLYPSQLKTIHLPPIVLYYQGNPVWETHNGVSLVGARKANYYGKNAVKKIVPGLIAHNLYVASGGAYGIDTCAHKETLDAGGATVVVLGSGLLRVYPVENTKMFQKIIQQGGAIISSFPCMAPGLPGNFPARNRIIAGLTHMTVVVQAAQKSGSLITAQYALEQGKSVGAIPGSIDDPLSAGCHSLLSQGAKVVTCAEDILEEYHLAKERKSVQMEIPYSADLLEDPVLFACRQPRGFEELVQITKMEENRLKEYLFDLQLEGIVEQNFAGLWQKV